MDQGIIISIGDFKLELKPMLSFYLVIRQLKKDLASAIEEHVSTETELRHETNRLENEIQSMIEEYDREMFRR